MGVTGLWTGARPGGRARSRDSGISTELISRPLVLLSGTSGHLRPKVFLVRGQHKENVCSVRERASETRMSGTSGLSGIRPVLGICGFKEP